MSAPAAPKDHSVKLAKMQQAAALEAQARQDKLDAEKKAELLQLRNNAQTSGISGAKDYFSQMGLDPDQYTNQIDSFINNLMAGISPDDPNPGAYLQDAGQRIFGQQELAGQNKNMHLLDTIFSPNFEMNRIPYTMDDPTLKSIEEEQYKSADDIIRNMLDRGVITNTGMGAAEADLGKQRAGVEAKLNEIGTGKLAEGQSRLRNVANQARQTASTLKLGTPFDPFSFGTQADTEFNDFINNLGTSIRGAVPGNLFNTAGLAALAGSAQGAGNTKFNPKAAAGIITDPADEQVDTTSDTNPF